MQVKNIGKEARAFDAGNQRAFNEHGARYDADTSASVSANEGNSSFLNQINPGNNITVIVVFDIPKDQTISYLELHDSLLSGGIKLSV